MKEETLSTLKSVATVLVFISIFFAVVFFVNKQFGNGFVALIAFAVFVFIELKLDEMIIEIFWKKNHRP